MNMGKKFEQGVRFYEDYELTQAIKCFTEEANKNNIV